MKASQASDVLFTVISNVLIEKDTGRHPLALFYLHSKHSDTTRVPVVTACHPREKGVRAWMV